MAYSRVGSQSHMDTSRFQRYHADVWIPDWLYHQVLVMLPLLGDSFRLSRKYINDWAKRGIPDEVVMPSRYQLIDVTTDTVDALIRACLRYPWSLDRDLVIVVEFPPTVPRPTVVTAYWNRHHDKHRRLNRSLYVQPPIEVSRSV